MKYTKEQINEARQKWLAQLRDPESKKLTLRLEDAEDPKARCCLGHACHALGLPRSVDTEHELATGSKLVLVLYGEDEHTDRFTSDVLPMNAAEMLDISVVGTFVKPLVHRGVQPPYMSLSDLNDESTLTPAEIADVIEEQFEKDNLMSYRASID